LVILVDLVVGNVGPPSGATDEAAVDGPLQVSEDSLVAEYEANDAGDVEDEGLVEIVDVALCVEDSVVDIVDPVASPVELLAVNEVDIGVVLD
jgi:hypothetical protein